MIAKYRIINTTKVALDSLDNLPINKAWVTLIKTYQTNCKVMSDHVYNMAFIKLTIILGLRTLFIISILASVLEHWARLKVEPFSTGVSMG